ncbi:MAG: hypothetical protein AB7U29_06070 [Desulfobulbus sp.]
MQPVYRLLPSATLALCLIAPLANSADARQTSISGSMGTGVNIRDRSYKQNQSGNSNDDQQKIFISPTITLSSQGVYDSISLQYTPSFNYDFIDDTNSVDHSLSFNGQRLLTSRWSVSLTDNYTLSDDPEASSSFTTTDSGSNSSSGSSDTTSQDTLSQDNFGSKYWTNAASIRSSYALFEKTSLSGGYTYSVLRNDGSQGSGNDAYNEYDKHAFFTNLSHGINAYWRTSLGLNYTRGLYDQPPADSTTASSNPNLDQYGLNFGIDYIQSVQDFFPLQYNLSETQYDSDTRSDTQSQEWSIGWNHSFDQQTSFSIGGGPSYAKTEGLEGQWGYNAYLTFTKQFEHATCSLQLDKRYETKNFTGTDQSGLSDTYNARANLAYQYTKDLGIDLFGRYSKESQIDPQGVYRDAVTGIATETQTGADTYDTNIYEAGVGFRYAFGRWYTAGLKYSYYVSDGQLDSDQYDEHRILFSISASKELWRW